MVPLRGSLLITGCNWVSLLAHEGRNQDTIKDVLEEGAGSFP